MPHQISYVNRHSVQGMLSGRYNPDVNFTSFIKNKKNAVVFPSNNSHELIRSYLESGRNVNIEYVIEEENDDYKCFGSNGSKIKSIISVFTKDYFLLTGKENREIRETRNKFDKIITIKTELNNLNEINDLVDRWNKLRGSEKYGWINHSGYDKNFFKTYYEKEKENLWSFFFYDKSDNLLGYSVVSKILDDRDKLLCYRYIIRKFEPNIRNLSLYIDFKTFQKIMEVIDEGFLIHWGASSRGLLKYKKKFPIYDEFATYFYRIKNENKE